MIMNYLLSIFIFLLLISCSENTKTVEADKSQGEQTEQVDNEEHEEHHHEAPNGGILTEVGEHAASLEWLIEEGQLKVYIFDGCAEKPIRVAQLEVKVSIKADKEQELTLSPVTNKLTGEKPGDSNTFSVAVSDLNKEKISAISVQSITIQGIDYKDVNLEVN